jgi:hypothetical protein|tara:strand:+ start:384 stop:800 length:417 start_codon:yes stop_codon:yes gene_type:complete
VFSGVLVYSPLCETKMLYFILTLIIISISFLIISLYSTILISIDFFEENNSNKKDIFIEPHMIPREMRPLDFQRNNELFQAELEFEKIESKIKILNENNLEYLLNEFEADKKQLEDDLFFELKRKDLEIKRLEIERRE